MKALRELDQLGNEISRNIQPSQQNAQKIKDQLELYGKKSDAFSSKDLNDKQKSELKEVREKYRDTLKGIRRQLPSLIEAQQRQERVMHEHVESEKQKKEEAKSERVDLFKEIDAAAKDYSTATTQNMMEKFEAFKALRSKLNEVLRVLPSSKERTADFQRLDTLAREVRTKHEDNLKLRQAMREDVQKRVEGKRKKVEQVFEKGGSLLDAALLGAPKEVRQAIGRVIENKDVMALLTSNEKLMQLLGENVTAGIKQITGNAEGSLVAVSEENRVAALEVILSELSKNENISPNDIVLVGQFLGTVVAMAKAAQQLQRGEKEFAVFVAEDKGHFKVMTVNINEFLIDPTAVGRIFSTFMEQGVTGPLHMQLASRKEAAAIAVVMNNVDVKALTGRMGALSHEELRSLTQGSMEGALVRGSGSELAPVTEAKTIPQIVALIAQSSRNIDVLARVLETTSPELGQQLTQAMTELDCHYANKPAKHFTEEEVFKIFTELFAMQLTAQDIGRVLRLPVDHPDRGGIGLFVNSSLFPSDSPGNMLMIMDSSIENDPVAQQLMLGVIPPVLQLEDRHDVGPVPVILPPKDTVVEPPKPIQPIQKKDDELDDEIEWGPWCGGTVDSLDEFDWDEPEPLKKERKAIDLSAQKAEFKALVNEVTKICEELGEKQEDHGEKYDAVMLQALNLRDLLKEQGKAFFALKHPTVEQADSFKAVCQDAIDNVMPEFEQHRGAWWDDSGLIGKLLTAVKAILGVLALVTVIPAVIIEDHTKHGYVHTFFGKPKTDSAVALGEVKTKLIEQGVELDEAVEEHNSKPSM